MEENKNVNGQETGEALSFVEKGIPYRFTSENQPANRGRKPSLYRIASEDYEVSYEDFTRVCKYLMQRSKVELVAISEADDTPMWIVNVCRALHKDSGKGNTYTLQWLANRFWGNPQDTLKMDANSRVTSVSVNVADQETADLVAKITNRTE